MRHQSDSGYSWIQPTRADKARSWQPDGAVVNSGHGDVVGTCKIRCTADHRRLLYPQSEACSSNRRTEVHRKAPSVANSEAVSRWPADCACAVQMSLSISEARIAERAVAVADQHLQRAVACTASSVEHDSDRKRRRRQCIRTGALCQQRDRQEDSCTWRRRQRCCAAAARS